MSQVCGPAPEPDAQAVLHLGRKIVIVREETGRFALDDGLTVVTVNRPATPVVAVLLLYRAGSVRDPEGLKGIAHLTEHMMFRGTPRHPDGVIDELTNELGGVNNAMTTDDYAAYYFVMPRESWRVALDLEADRMSNCLLDPSAFEAERGIAIEERRMLHDEPEASLDEALERIAYERHPYGSPVVGLEPDLRRATVADLRAFYDLHYVPSNAVLSVVGSVERAEVERAVRESFPQTGVRVAPDASALRDDRPPVPSEPAQSAWRSVVMTRDSGIPRLTVGFHCPEATHPDSPALEVLATLLGTGRSSRLYRRLVATDGRANDVSIGHLLQPYPGLFTVSVELSEGGNVAASEEAVLDVLSSVAREAPTVDELDKAKRLWTLDHRLGGETSLGLAGRKAFWELLGDWRLGDGFAESVEDVTRDDLVRVAGDYLDPAVRNSAWLNIVE